MIKLKCPRCGVVWHRESLEVVVKEIEEMWKYWEDSMTEEQKQMVRKTNNPKRLQAILDKEGHLDVLCKPCRLFLTVEAMKNLKIHVNTGIGG